MIEVRTKYDVYLISGTTNVHGGNVRADDLNCGIVKRLILNDNIPVFAECMTTEKTNWLNDLTEYEKMGILNNCRKYINACLEVIVFPSGSRVTDVYGNDFDDMQTAEKMLRNGFFLIDTDKDSFRDGLLDARSYGFHPIPLKPYNVVKGEVFDYCIPKFSVLQDWYRVSYK